jgi:hypothetical protein
MTRLMASISVIVLVACGCGGNDPGASVDAGADLAPVRDVGAHATGKVSPPAHRSDDSPCPPRGPSMSQSCAGQTAPGSCATDADCTAGQDGRCTGGGIAICTCTYDQCNRDSDCSGGQACACHVTLRGLPQGSGPNTCVTANCRSDADCGSGGVCSPSMSVTACVSAIDGYYCHTPKDECGTDADCVADEVGVPACVYDSVRGHWACTLRSFCAG